MNKFTLVLKNREAFLSFIGLQTAKFGCWLMPKRLRKSFTGAVMNWAVHVAVWGNKHPGDMSEVPPPGDPKEALTQLMASRQQGFPIVAEALDVTCGIVCNTETNGHEVFMKVGGEKLTHEGALAISEWFKNHLSASAGEGFVDSTKMGEQNTSKSLH